MSYLHLAESSIADFTKAVISLWFRVPQETIAAAAAAYSAGTSATRFRGVVPFVVMGKKGKNFLGNSDLDPTYIGALCPGWEGDTPAKAYLVVNFETAVEGTVIGDPPDNKVHSTCFFSGGEQHELDGDEWHHVLISVELKDMASHGWEWDETITQEPVTTTHIESVSHLWIALDDINYTGNELSGYHPFDNSDPQSVIDNDCQRIANMIQSVRPFVPGEDTELPGPDGPVPHYSITGLKIPCNGQPMGLPATTEFVENIRQVEMAEFQMWTDQTLDTGDLSNRQAFVKDGKPVDPKQAEKLLGRPAILLHGSSNWIAGFNTGTNGLAITAGKETKLPEGQFERVARIEPYKPDPSLEETTS